MDRYYILGFSCLACLFISDKNKVVVGVSVTIFKEIYNEKYLSKLNLNDRQKTAIKAVKKAGHITNSEYRALFNVADRTVLQDVDELIKLSIFKKEGEGRNTKYVIDTSGYTL